MTEIGEVTDYIQNKAGFDADLIWGNGKEESLGDNISVTVIATGFNTSSISEIQINKLEEQQNHNLVETENTETIRLRIREQASMRRADWGNRHRENTSLDGTWVRSL